MSDYISRQAAIDAILDMNVEHRVSWMDAVIDTIDALPSAQPEQQWIPMSERPPEEIGTYMTTIACGRAGLAVGQRYYCGKYLGWEDERVIAWMPRPDPWEGEKS